MVANVIASIFITRSPGLLDVPPHGFLSRAMPFSRLVRLQLAVESEPDILQVGFFFVDQSRTDCT